MQNYIKQLKKELSRLNRIIDARIIQGKDYDKEAKMHRAVVLNLSRYGF